VASRSSKGTYKPYVVVSGLPGSGKSTLAQRLAPLLNLPVIDKDDILERLFEIKGIGDAAWRRALSREGDQLFQTEAFHAQGAILVSFWHLPGMEPDSGTPTDWLGKVSDRVVNVACRCAPDVAAERCFQRTRHPGHLDGAASKEEVLASIQSISCLNPLEIGRRIEVDTSVGHPALDAIAREIFSALHDLGAKG
jgi:hypothetical protein